ncbi:MAG TPA: GspE/PulE family protein [Thiobacillaceae bacterium]|nr:GspE/PulE family protein [Thiobacillaceae bacterium]HNA82125.1 GspE/PulE family protein [Thiobacillaceae bacterium]HNF88345.1 GspE/PulE family protein [Thiobacillaceae bacterium]HNH88533.1 GspE/PulE family protein [Thiobacillaceae bacterium]HNI06787.1 GspE/PulE family protein [Thiobacillaceae bacterium]
MSTQVIDSALVARARAEAAGRGVSVLTALRESLALPQEAFLASLAQAFAYPALDMARLRDMRPAFDLIPFAQCLDRECAACLDEAGGVWFVFADPLDSTLEEWAQHRLPDGFTAALALRDDILAWLHRLESGLRAMDGVGSLAGEGGTGDAVEEISLQAIGADASPVVKLTHSTLYDALTTGASDIHLENDPAGLAIKYRIDGVLTQIAHAPGREMAEQVISRIKVMAELDIAERRVPQDGRFKVNMRGREIDLRVSIMPGVFGEDAVLRVLDRQQLSDELKGITLERLGFDVDTLARVRRLAREPYGMVLVTGPTGSGKTTTLYAALSEINTGRDKIITIEDPVEYQLGGVLQIPVNEKKGLTFARGLRSILRHDPDKIMVGEIRDPETAQIAVQSALTGHLVFTTVHANNVFDVIGRMMHMGLDPYSFVSALNGVLAQRLVRVNCPHCAEPYTPSAPLLADSGLASAEGFDLRAGRGCGQCRGTGYKGRKAIAEMLLLTDEIRELIVARAPIRALKEAAFRSGVKSLREAALDMARRGETTLEEINRVTFVA